MNERKVIYKGKDALLIKIDNTPLPKQGLSGVELLFVSVGTIIVEGNFLVVPLNELHTAENSILPVVENIVNTVDQK